ncbi:sigma-70 family RNA polymerase sigma factor [Stieleria varia]|uniref:RNA polymerase sigma factor SigM n=2 Tax=Stieleria varia TaxID=2528005 RepID=A0A5C6A5G3_9BACT|nr:RNA polymerase sigma factor SigM [Stieleria varia]
MPHKSASDATLLIRFQAGDEDAATAIYSRYAKQLLSLANRNSGEALASRVDPEDIVQSIFRTFFRRASQGHYQIPDGDELWKLFLIIALNKVRSVAEFHRAAKRNAGQTQTLGNFDAGDVGDTSEILRITIEEVLLSLPEDHQAVVRDRIDGFEVKEIAERNATSRRSVERILQGFRNRLRKSLELT